MFCNTSRVAFQPFSYMRDEFPLMGRGPGDLLDKWMEISEPWSTGTLERGFSPCSKPGAHCCPHACVPQRSQRSCRQHFVVLPSLLTVPTSSDHKGRDQKSDKGATCSDQCQGKDTANSEQTVSAPTGKDATEGSSNGNTHEESPWQFSVDMKGCDEVRATTENDMLVVEGRGSSDTSQQMMRYITSLPRHVNHDSLTARLTNGRLTVTQKPGTQLEGQARTLPIDVQQQESVKPEQQQQQQQQEEEEEEQNTEVAEQREKEISSTDAQEEH